MDAPPTKGEDVRPFVQIARWLADKGFSAPTILVEDAQHGFLLIEDLGDALFARVLELEPPRETQLYQSAVDALVALHACPPPEVSTYDPATMADLACLAFDWYQKGTLGKTDLSARGTFHAALLADLTPLADDLNVLVLRDYHAENLIWLPEREGIARVGLLDFQDGQKGHRAYDLVSVLQDARRDVEQGLAADMFDRYLSATNLDPDPFRKAYALMGLQRNLRILGVFARLSLLYGKPHYVDLIPRVWSHLQRNLDHPELGQLGKLLSSLPEPTDEHLELLKQKCATDHAPS